MSGHNKWSKIKHKKAATDAKKSKEFTRLVREIKVAVRDAGGEENASGVQLAVSRAKTANMPKDNIERAIKSAQGLGSENLTEALYESYGPGGVAILIETITDNTNRTAAEIKKLLSDSGLDLASPGSATWAFAKENGSWIPKQTVELSSQDSEKLDACIEKIEDNDDVQSIVTNKA